MSDEQYSRFTDRARKVMQLANQEAQRFNHEYIGTEHILLGLIKEGGGIAADVLKNLDVDLRKIRLEVEKLVQSGPDMVTMGKLPQTPRAKKVIEYSMEEARNFNHNYVGTVDILLGLLREQEGVAAQVLMNLGLKLEDVREEVLNLLGHGTEGGEFALPTEWSDELPMEPGFYWFRPSALLSAQICEVTDNGRSFLVQWCGRGSDVLLSVHSPTTSGACLWLGPLPVPPYPCDEASEPSAHHTEPCRPAEEDMISRPCICGLGTVRKLVDKTDEIVDDMVGLAAQVATLRRRIHACEQQHATAVILQNTITSRLDGRVSELEHWSKVIEEWKTATGGWPDKSPKELEWLPGKPTKPGFYFYEGDLSDLSIKTQPTYPPLIGVLFLSRFEIAAGWGEGESDSLSGRWAGPIPTPRGYTPTGEKIEDELNEVDR